MEEGGVTQQLARRYLEAAMCYFGDCDEDTFTEEHLAEIIIAALHLVDSLSRRYYSQSDRIELGRGFRLAMEDISEN